MRIVGGTLGGRRFGGPSGEGTRPTAERVREAIASAIQSRGGFDGTRVLDLYAGTGAMAFEALSRGAAHATLVERDPKVARAITKAASELGIEQRCAVVTVDAESRGAVARISGGPFDRVFVDPPYARIDAVGPLLDVLADAGLLAPDALVVVEHALKQPPTVSGRFDEISHPRYGDTGVLILSLAEAPP